MVGLDGEDLRSLIFLSGGEMRGTTRISRRWLFGRGAGVLLGSLTFVQENFSLLIYGIILVSVLPVVVEWAKYMLKNRRKE